MKVGYVTVGGRESTAYLDDKPDAAGVHRGVNKHTGEDVAVRWYDDLRQWRELPHDYNNPVWSAKPRFLP